MQNTHSIFLQEIILNPKTKHSISEYQLSDVIHNSGGISSKRNFVPLKLTIFLEITMPALLSSFGFKSIYLDHFLEHFRFLEADYQSELQSNNVGNSKNFYNKMIAGQETVCKENNTGFLKINAIAYAKKIKISFLTLKNQISNNIANKFDIPNELALKEENLLTVFLKFFQNIQFFGYNLHCSPHASQMIPLMNISTLFNKNKRIDECMETNILVGLSLINARRFLQASELLKKTSEYFYKIYENSNEPNRAKVSSFLMVSPKDSTVVFSNQPSIRNKLLIKAAKIELLAAEAIKQPSMINEKVLSYWKATDLYFNQQQAPSQINLNCDIYTVLLKIGPNLASFLIKILFEKLEPLKIAALRGLEFLIEYLGCTIGSFLPYILKAMLITYPGWGLNENFMLNDLNSLHPLNSPITMYTIKIEENSQNTSQNNYLMLDIYHHLLETFLNVISSASSQLLRELFNDIVLPNIFLSETNNELKIFILRIAEKIISISQGDLLISVNFVANMLLILQHMGQGVKSTCQKLWSTVKNKSIVNFSKNDADQLTEWLFENLMSSLKHNEFTLNLGYYLEIVLVLTVRERKIQENLMFYSNKNQNNSNDLDKLIKPLAYWLSLCVENQFSLDIFKQIWSTLLEIYSLGGKEKGIKEIIIPLLQQIHLISLNGSLSQIILNYLIIILNSLEENEKELDDFFKEFLNTYCECVPQSVFDETFIVFDILLKRCKKCLNYKLLEKCINSLLDQFTVKSKAQKQSKNLLISLVIKSKIEYFHFFLQICLFENQEPQFENLPSILNSSRNFDLSNVSGIFSSQKPSILASKSRKKNIDTKLLNKQHDLFLEKINFCQEFLLEIQLNHIDHLIICIKNMCLQDSLSKLMISGNSKIRLRALNMVKLIYNAFLKFCVGKEHKGFSYTKVIISKLVLYMIKISLENYNDPKLQFNSLLILDDFFQKTMGSPELIDEINRKNLGEGKHQIIDIFNYDFGTSCDLLYSDDTYIHLRLYQIIKLLPCIQNLINSQWSNIRSLSYGIICYWVRPNLNLYKPSLQLKLTNHLFSILLSLLTSKEAECRTGGLNILGSLCGLGFNFSDCRINVNQLRQFFRRHENLISLAIWETVFDLQHDWDPTNQAAATTIIQLCAPKEAIRQFWMLRKETVNLQQNNTNCFYQENIINSPKFQSKQFDHESETEPHTKLESAKTNSQSTEIIFEESEFFWMERSNSEELRELISMFRNEYKPPESLWIERGNYSLANDEGDYDRYVSETDEIGNFFTIDDEVMNQEGVIRDDEPFDDDLGIIEVDDEQWNEYYDDEQKTLKNHKNYQKIRERKMPNENKERIIEKKENNIKNERNQGKNNDENSALRPHNLIFRPLTPPVRNDNENNGNIKKNNRPNSGLQRKDSVELYEIKENFIEKKENIIIADKNNEILSCDSPLKSKYSEKIKPNDNILVDNWIEKLEFKKKKNKNIEQNLCKSTNCSSNMLNKLIESLTNGDKTFSKTPKANIGQKNLTLSQQNKDVLLRRLLKNVRNLDKINEKLEKTHPQPPKRSTSLGKSGLLKKKQNNSAKKKKKTEKIRFNEQNFIKKEEQENNQTL